MTKPHPPFHPDGSPCHCQALTYQSAMALAREHATDHMICAGRVRWNEADWLVAAEMFDQIMGEEGRQS